MVVEHEIKEKKRKIKPSIIFPATRSHENNKKGNLILKLIERSFSCKKYLERKQKAISQDLIIINYKCLENKLSFFFNF